MPEGTFQPDTQALREACQAAWNSRGRPVCAQITSDYIRKACRFGASGKVLRRAPDTVCAPQSHSVAAGARIAACHDRNFLCAGYVKSLAKTHDDGRKRPNRVSCATLFAAASARRTAPPAAPVAQWIEYCPPKAGVAGSIPAGRANFPSFQSVLRGAAGTCSGTESVSERAGFACGPYVRELRAAMPLCPGLITVPSLNRVQACT